MVSDHWSKLHKSLGGQELQLLTLNKTVHTRKNIQVGNPKNYVNIDTYSPALKFFPDYKNGSKIKLYDEHKKDKRSQNALLETQSFTPILSRLKLK